MSLPDLSDMFSIKIVKIEKTSAESGKNVPVNQSCNVDDQKLGVK